MMRVVAGSLLLALTLVVQATDAPSARHVTDTPSPAHAAAAPSAVAAPHAATAVGLDVRLVVDVSGSMKSGDPEYLRQDVLNDLVEALPENSRGGVWTFGGTVNNVVPHGAIDEAWRRTARAARSSIVSAAPLTNLFDALANAAWDVDTPMPNWDRHVLLVTDGRIDVGRDAARNDAQRRAIVEQWLPRLRAAGIRLDCIALSRDADLAFLTQLADATDGRAGRADTVVAVKDYLARTYGAATPPMGAFVITEDVAELTVHAQDGDPLSLVSPRGDTIDATRARDGVRWRAGPGGAWATVSKPAPGRWRFTPATAAAFSDLELAVRSNDSAEAPSLRAAVLDGSRPLDPALRDAVSIEATLTTLYGSEALPVTSVADAAAFDVALGSPLTADDDVVLQLVGPTFERKRTYVEMIVHPIDVDVRDGGDGTAVALARANFGNVDPATLRILATSSVADGGRATLGVGEKQPDGAWQMVVPALGKSVDVRLKLLFKDVDGRDVEIATDSVALNLPLAKARRVGFDADGHVIVDPVRPPPHGVPIETAPAVAVALTEPVVAPAITERDAPMTRAPQLWEWLVMLVIAFASVASLAWFFARRGRLDDTDAGFDATLASYRDALASATAKPQAATTT